MQQLADRLGVKEQTIYAWNHKRSGPRFMKIGRLPRYRLSDVVAWENSRYASGPEAV
ncbi:helix-turn-helix transcriptional regulator [Actinocorallia longicatena]|uniref:helix-turn-helix transcriptional regulator n=1 Tax=Actinocorallia longicatena TaxID=111803 RepID=UPI003CD0A6C9